MKINIVGFLPQDMKSATPFQKNMYEEVALFLDSQPTQELIKQLRARINLTATIPYKTFEEWITSAKFQDEWTKEEQIELYDLNNEIDELENKTFNLLSPDETKELNKKKDESARWREPRYTFSKNLKRKLANMNKSSYFNIVFKAVVCGEIRLNDIDGTTLTRKNARGITHQERKAFWLYDNSDDIGYGTVAKKLGILPKTATSRINSYKKKLATYEATTFPSNYRFI